MIGGWSLRQPVTTSGMSLTCPFLVRLFIIYLRPRLESCFCVNVSCHLILHKSSLNFIIPLLVNRNIALLLNEMVKVSKLLNRLKFVWCSWQTQVSILLIMMSKLRRWCTSVSCHFSPKGGEIKSIFWIATFLFSQMWFCNISCCLELPAILECFIIYLVINALYMK